MLCLGSARVEATVQRVEKREKASAKASAKKKVVRVLHVTCRMPVCGAENERVAVFAPDSSKRHWRLVAAGKLAQVTACTSTTFYCLFACVCSLGSFRWLYVYVWLQ
jgi:hypothetical protein